MKRSDFSPEKGRAAMADLAPPACSRSCADRALRVAGEPAYIDLWRVSPMPDT